jgi:chemotaxis protein MotA
MDFASLGGIVLALLGIVAGLVLEGGSVRQIAQPTAAMIVLGGTLGAVLLQFPIGVVWAAVKEGFRVFRAGRSDGAAMLERILVFAHKARKSGLLALDEDLGTVEDAFLKQALMLVVDGTDPGEVRRLMELELENKADLDERVPAVFEAMGGYSPTVGIIGAVLGLIQVMQHLDHIDEVGRGIATAFVATIYGVGLANLVFLPVAGKLKGRRREEERMKEMMLEGVISIVEGLNPRMIEMKLRTYLAEAPAAAKGPQGRRRGEALA